MTELKRITRPADSPEARWSAPETIHFPKVGSDRPTATIGRFTVRARHVRHPHEVIIAVYDGQTLHEQVVLKPDGGQTDYYEITDDRGIIHRFFHSRGKLK